MRRMGGWVVPWKTVSVSTLIAAVPMVIGLNHAYVGWHQTFGDARYAKKAELLAAQSTMASNSSKLDRIALAIDGIQIQTAITTEAEFSRQYDSWLARPRDSIEWINERDRLKRQLDRAEAYKKCLIEQRPNCDQLRGW